MVTLQEAVRVQCPDVAPALIDMHFRRMPAAYQERCSVAETGRHLRLLNRLAEGRLVAVEAKSLGGSLLEVIIGGIDLTGVLACITSALAADGFSVQDLQLATYLEPEEGAGEPTYFLDVIRVQGAMRGRSLATIATSLQNRLQESFTHLSGGRFAQAQATAGANDAAEAARSTPSPLRATMPTLVEGQVLGGDFKLIRKLSGGGMSHVYLAHQLSLDRPAVVKLVSAQRGDDQQILVRFSREISTLAKFSCPHIVQVLATGGGSWTGRGNLQWLAMEYLSGGDLGQWIQEHGRPAWDIGVRWFRQALEALNYAHRHGILHRDLKPHNIFLTAEGDAKVGDFGLVKEAGSAGDMLSLPGTIMGTPHYMSPEQAQGENVDERSDLYSLGSTFYHVFSGKLPFERQSYTAVLVAITQQQEAPRLKDALPDVPRPLDAIFTRLLAPHPDSRYQNARIVLEDLTSYEQRGLLTCAERGPDLGGADSGPKTVQFKPWDTNQRKS